MAFWLVVGEVRVRRVITDKEVIPADMFKAVTC